METQEQKDYIQRVRQFLFSNNPLKDFFPDYLYTSDKAKEDIAKTLISLSAELFSCFGYGLTELIAIKGQDHFALIAHGDTEYMLDQLYNAIKVIENRRIPITDAEKWK